MSDNVQKIPFSSSQNTFAAGKAQEAISLLGKALPCSVVAIPTAGIPIVTVKFEITDPTFTTLPNVTIPVLGAEYVRLPLQIEPGTRGVVFSIDAYLGGISGLGGGVADLSQRGNLTTLIFVPVGNKSWQAVAANKLTLYGVDGTVIQDTIDNASSVAITPSNISLSAVNKAATQAMTSTGISLAVANGASESLGVASINLTVPGGASIAMSATAIQLTCAGHTLVINSSGISLDNKLFATHLHTAVQSGTSDTGPVA